MRILLLEDDKTTSSYLVRALNEVGHVVDLVSDGRDALIQGAHEQYDLALLDRMTPGLDGLSLLKALRAAKVSIPVLMLTAIGNVEDRVEGLEAGADDYLVKPFAFSELLARINALSRRPKPQDVRLKLTVADLEIDIAERSARRAGVSIELQPREFKLLEALMRAEGRVVTRTMLLERVWDFHFDPKTSVVETHISRLRAKIDKPFSKPLIHTVRNTGYSLHAGR